MHIPETKLFRNTLTNRPLEKLTILVLYIEYNHYTVWISLPTAAAAARSYCYNKEKTVGANDVNEKETT